MLQALDCAAAAAAAQERRQRVGGSLRLCVCVRARPRVRACVRALTRLRRNGAVRLLGDSARRR